MVNRKILTELIFQIAKDDNAFDTLENNISQITVNNLKDIIIECGVMPEVFTHDSSEEKLYAKYSDIILSISLNHLNIQSSVLRTRGNSADVFGKTDSYSIVGDAKTFRLSRTAKNQKDFKIKALDDWRRNDDFAILVGALNQFPIRTSQI